MPENIQQQRIFPYDGQQDLSRHPLLIAANDIIDTDNIVYTTYSTKKLRPGIVEFLQKRPAGNNHILGQFDFHRLGSQRTVWYDGQRIYASARNGVVDDITGNYVLPVDEAISFTVFSGLLIICFQDGLTSPKIWNQVGAIQELSTDAPNGRYPRIFLNCVWMDDPSVPGRIIKSDSEDPTDFTGGDSLVLDLDTNDGDPDGVTAIFPPVHGSLYVAKRLSLYRITPIVNADGDIVFQVLKISDGVGCNSHNGAVAIEDVIIFTSDRGIHMLNQTDKVSSVESTFLSLVIQPFWDRDFNTRRSKFISGVYDVSLNSYLFIFPVIGSRFPTDLWGYNVSVGKFYRWRDYNQTSIARYIDYTTKKLRTMVGSKFGDLGVIDSTRHSDYGKKYSLGIVSGIVAPTGAPDGRYAFKFLTPVFVPQLTGEFKITYKINGKSIETLTFPLTPSEDFGDELAETFKLGSSSLGGLPQFKIDKRSLLGYGMTYQLLIEFTPTQAEEDDEDFELLGVLMDVDQVEKTIGEVEG